MFEKARLYITEVGSETKVLPHSLVSTITADVRCCQISYVVPEVS